MGMRTIYDYRPVRFRKIKSLLVTVLLLAMAFLAGAAAEKTAHFLQDVMDVAPVALDGVKTFLRERFVFKINAAADQVKWGAVITFSIITEPVCYLIRGP